jgi:hypothetical protein
VVLTCKRRRGEEEERIAGVILCVRWPKKKKVEGGAVGDQGLIGSGK